MTHAIHHDVRCTESNVQSTTYTIPYKSVPRLKKRIYFFFFESPNMINCINTRVSVIYINNTLIYFCTNFLIFVSFSSLWKRLFPCHEKWKKYVFENISLKLLFSWKRYEYRNKEDWFSFKRYSINITGGNNNEIGRKFSKTCFLITFKSS